MTRAHEANKAHNSCSLILGKDKSFDKREEYAFLIVEATQREIVAADPSPPPFKGTSNGLNSIEVEFQGPEWAEMSILIVLSTSL